MKRNYLFVLGLILLIISSASFATLKHRPKAPGLAIFLSGQGACVNAARQFGGKLQDYSDNFKFNSPKSNYYGKEARNFRQISFVDDTWSSTCYDNNCSVATGNTCFELFNKLPMFSDKIHAVIKHELDRQLQSYSSNETSAAKSYSMVTCTYLANNHSTVKCFATR